MTYWEYKYIHLYSRHEPVARPLEAFEAEVAQAGADGWEAVGQITCSRDFDGYRNTTTWPMLLLKRALE